MIFLFIIKIRRLPICLCDLYPYMIIGPMLEREQGGYCNVLDYSKSHSDRQVHSGISIS